MDSSIIPLDRMADRGADAFDAGLSVTSHDMTPGSSAAKLWEYGWHGRRVERARMRGNHGAKLPTTTDQLEAA